MIIKTGCDLVEIKKFKASAERGSKKFLNKIFSNQELASSSSMPSLAGIFAAKEAIIKTSLFKVGDWQKIEIIKNSNGRPQAHLEQNALSQIEKNYEIVSQDISISHDGAYAMAIAMFIVRKKK